MKLDKSKLGAKLESAAKSEGAAVLAARVAAAEEVARTGSFAPVAAKPVAPATPATSAAAQVVMEIEIDRIVDNPYDACPIKDEGLVAEIAESIAAIGQKQPVLVAPGLVLGPQYADRYIMVEGHHRRLSITRLKRLTIRTLVLDEVQTERDLFEISQAVNDKRRKDIAAINQAISWANALEKGLYKTDLQLAERNAINRSTVSRTLAILKLPEFVLSRMRAEPKRVGLRMGYALFQYHQAAGEDETRRLADDLFDGKSKLTAEDVERLIPSSGAARPSRKRKQNSRQFKVQMGETRLGVLKEWDSGRIVVDVKVEDPEARKKLLSQLKDTLKIES